MFITASSIVRSVFAVALFAAPASLAAVRGDMSPTAMPQAQDSTAPAFALADQIDAMLTMRFTAADSVESRDARRQALEALDQFAKITVEGLIEASPSGEMRTVMDERLRPVLVRHQHNIAAALADVETPSTARGVYAPTVSGGF